MQRTANAIKKRIATRFSLINALFVITILLITIMVSGSLISDLIDTVSEDYVRFYTNDSVDKLNSQLSSEISLVRRVTRTPEVIAWFADEDNPEKKAEAYRVMMIYHDILQLDSLYFVISDSLNEYSVDYGTPLDEVMPFNSLGLDNLYDQWFFRAVSSPLSFELNIDECKVRNTARLWINYKVTDDSGNVVGIFCSALNLDDLFFDLYGGVDDRNVKKFVIDNRGVIRIDSSVPNPDLISAFNPTHAEEVYILSLYSDEAFVSILNRFRLIASIFPDETEEPEVIKLESGRFNYLSVAPIPGTTWLTVTFYNSSALFSTTDVLMPIIAVILAFIIFIAANAVLIRQMVLKPLKRLMSSLAESDHDGGKIYGVDRDDEVGAFAREMQQSWIRLGESSKHSQLMLDATPLSCTLWDYNTNIFDCNYTVVELFGLKSKQEYKESFMKFLPEYQPCGRLTADLMKESVEKAIMSESGKYVLEFMHVLPSGELLPVEITIVKISDGSGAYFATYGRDLREHKRMMSEIEQRDRLLRVVNQVAYTLLSTENSESDFNNKLRISMNMMAETVGADRAYIWKNHVLDSGESGASQMYEWLEDGAPAQDKTHTLNVSYQAHMPDLRATLLKGECVNGITREMSSVTHKFMSKTGVLSVFAAPIFIQEEFWGFVGFDNCRKEQIMSDHETSILKSGCLLIGNAFLRHNTMQDLKLQTVTLTTLFDSIPSFIFIKDLNLRYIQCNQFLLSHFGLKKEELIGKDDKSGLNLPDEIADEFKMWDNKIISEKQTLTFTEHVPGVDGNNPFCETVKAPLILNNEVIGILGISHDITKHKEMEEAALEASRSKSAFLANMSHEIRTPMNSIIGFSELALSDNLSSKAKDYLEKIIQNSEWLLQIINDILDISKIESGKMELENIPFDLREVFGACKGLVAPKAEEKGLTMHFYAEPSVGKRISGDPTRLRQVLVNLLSNAIKFTNSGMIKMQAVVKETTDDSVTMSFEVKDSGIGIPDEQIQKIFTPFIQAESGTTRQYGGSGLGLSITKNIVEMMGGELLVESTVGVGSKFNFEIKFSAENIADESEPINKEDYSDIEKPEFDGEILLLEDNAMNQQVICEHLARVGIKTVVAKNGEIGVEIARNRKFDLIFMDIHMPVMDGIEATQKIREFDTEIPIIAMTANIMAGDMEVYKASGMNDCVGKPFTSQELWRCLLKYLTPSEEKEPAGIK